MSETKSSIAAADKKAMRRIAHHLDTVVIVGDAGVTEGVIAETERALTDHELIKVKFAAPDRDARRSMTDSLVEACAADIVQRIGKVAVLYRSNPKANPNLSNLHRFGGRG